MGGNTVRAFCVMQAHASGYRFRHKCLKALSLSLQEIGYAVRLPLLGNRSRYTNLTYDVAHKVKQLSARLKYSSPLLKLRKGKGEKQSKIKKEKGQGTLYLCKH